MARAEERTLAWMPEQEVDTIRRSRRTNEGKPGYATIMLLLSVCAPNERTHVLDIGVFRRHTYTPVFWPSRRERDASPGSGGPH
jgi:hypothetical protein